MALKINGTTVVNDSRGLENISNLKTVRGQSLLGSGDIPITSSASSKPVENPKDNTGTGNIRRFLPDVSVSNFPNCFAFHPNGQFCFVGNDYSRVITTFKINQNTGEFTQVSSINISGNGIKNIIIHPAGTIMYVSTFQMQALIICSINPKTGELQINGNGANALSDGAHGMAINAAATYLYVCGSYGWSTTTVTVYSIDPNTYLLTKVGNSFQYAAEGSQHIALHPNDNILYVSSYNNNRVTAFLMDSQKTISLANTYSFPAASSPTGLLISKDGAYLYVSLANIKGIEVRKINPATSELTGTTGYATSGTAGCFMMNAQNTVLYGAGAANYLDVFSVSKSTGELTLMESINHQMMTASSIGYNPNTNFLYVSHGHNNLITCYSVNSANFGTVGVKNLSYGDHSLVSSTKTLVASGNVTVDSFKTSEFSGAIYQVRTMNGFGRHVCEISLVHDNINVSMTKYGDASVSAIPGTFSANLTSGVINLVFSSSVSTQTDIRLVRTAFLP